MNKITSSNLTTDNQVEREDNSFNPLIEEVLSSKGRVRILKTLAIEEELNISAIARQSKLNHSTTSNHLEFLEKAGLVQEKNFGRIKIFRFRIENTNARALKRLFEIWE
jgi:DNA-binding transcriptional ArsR family regulator